MEENKKDLIITGLGLLGMIIFILTLVYLVLSNL